MRKFFFLVCVCVISFSFTPAYSANFFGSIGASFGGDDVDYAQDVYGNYYGTPISETLFAGGGVTLNPLGDKFEIQLGGYYHLGSDSTGGVDYTMTQFSFESLFCLLISDYRIGAGPVFFTGPQMEVSDSSSTDDYDVDSAVGYSICFDYFFVNKDFGRLSFGVKYTKVDFELNEKTWNGDNISFNLGLYFK